jgi:hypothetical protein
MIGFQLMMQQPGTTQQPSQGTPPASFKES